MLQIGSRGDAVKALQRKLGVTADGIFGPQTQAALISWQRRNGLAADGVYGPKSQAKMNGAGTAAKSSGSTRSGQEASDLAAKFGYSVAFFNSDPELKKLLGQAVSGNWTPAQFVAKLQATKWFKKNGEAARQVIALKTSDPATYKQRLDSAHHQVASAAKQVGAVLSSAQVRSFAELALRMGWTEEQIRSSVSKYIKPDKGGIYHGAAATAQEQIKELAGAYGYSLSQSQLGAWTRSMATGAYDINAVRQAIVNVTASKYPALAERLKAGETLDDIASPYKDSYSKILEVNGRNISLDDPLLKKAFSVKDSKGKPSTQTVWQFEKDLKSDPRWLKTNNAREELVGTTRKLLSDMGLVL